MTPEPAHEYDELTLLGMICRDKLTGITGVLNAVTAWSDRSAECTIQRDGLTAEGEPFAVHWFPASRLGVA